MTQVKLFPGCTGVAARKKEHIGACFSSGGNKSASIDPNKKNGKVMRR